MSTSRNEAGHAGLGGNCVAGWVALALSLLALLIATGVLS